jgi:hypothetical protein
LIILEKVYFVYSTGYKGPHDSIAYILLTLYPSLFQMFSSAPCSETPSICVLRVVPYKSAKEWRKYIWSLLHLVQIPSGAVKREWYIYGKSECLGYVSINYSMPLHPKNTGQRNLLVRRRGRK